MRLFRGIVDRTRTGPGMEGGASCGEMHRETQTFFSPLPTPLFPSLPPLVQGSRTFEIRWEIFPNSNYRGEGCGRLGTVPLSESEPSFWLTCRPHRAGIAPSHSGCPVLFWASPTLKVLLGSFLSHTLPSQGGQGGSRCSGQESESLGDPSELWAGGRDLGPPSPCAILGRPGPS